MPITYDYVIEDTLRDIENEINYNNNVVKIAALSIIIWLIGLIWYAVCKKDWHIIFDIELYPAPVWAFITGAFSELETLERKQDLHILLKNHLDGSEEVAPEKLKDTSWVEFINVSK